MSAPRDMKSLVSNLKTSGQAEAAKRTATCCDAEVDIHAIQEQKAKGNAYWKAVARVVQANRNMVGTQSIPGPNNGFSSGTALIINKAVDMVEPTVKQTDAGKEYQKCAIVQGRAAAVIINNWNRTGLMIISVYLDFSG